MPLFTIDESLCLGDGLCALACPASLVRQSAPGETPHPLEGKEAHCIGCGHCAAVCPVGALELEALPGAMFTYVMDELEVTFEQARQLFSTRRSIRNFKKEPVPRETVLRLLRAAQYAPSGHNEHGVGYAVVSGRERVEEIATAAVDVLEAEVRAGTPMAKSLNLDGLVRAWRKGRDVITRGAPQLVFVHAPESGVTPGADAVIAAAHVELLAHAMGLGACWCGYLMYAARNGEISAVAGVPDGERVGAVLMLGRPRLSCRRIPPRPEPRVAWT